MVASSLRDSSVRCVCVSCERIVSFFVCFLEDFPFFSFSFSVVVRSLCVCSQKRNEEKKRRGELLLSSFVFLSFF